MSARTLVLVLAAISGFIDAYGFLSYRTYVSFMSGNTTQSGFLLSRGQIAAATPQLSAIVFFVLGVFTGTFVTHSTTRHSARPVLLIVAILLAGFVCAVPSGLLGGVAGIAMLALTMGIMNTAVSRIGTERVNVAFVTGTLNTMAQQLALAIRRAPTAKARATDDTHASRAFYLFRVWACFLVGAILAAAATTALDAWVLLLPAAILLSLAVLGERRLFEDHGDL